MNLQKMIYCMALHNSAYLLREWQILLRDCVAACKNGGLNPLPPLYTPIHAIFYSDHIRSKV